MGGAVCFPTFRRRECTPVLLLGPQFLYQQTKREGRQLALSERDKSLAGGGISNNARKLYQELYAVLSNGETLSDADFTSVTP